MPTAAEKKKMAISSDTLPLKGIDHLELWVGNAKQAAYFYRQAMGFDLVAWLMRATELNFQN